VIPILINTNLTWLDISSGYISIGKECIIKLIYALSTASKLVSLSLAGWKFNVEVKLSMILQRDRNRLRVCFTEQLHSWNSRSIYEI
jgi:hypothetical protein